MRLLGVDLGKVRIGVAVGETEPRVVTPRPTLAASGTLRRDADALAQLAKKEEAEAVVVGLPIGLDGQEDGMTKACRLLADLLRERGYAVHLVDETMSSVQAEASLLEAGLKASERRRKRDGEAASLILERFMNGA